MRAATALFVGQLSDTSSHLTCTCIRMFSCFKTEHGADIVVHSVTKYINGHSDVVMGVVCTNSEDIYKQLRFIQNGVGAVPSPFDCYLAHRGLKTLHLRMEASAR